MMQQPKLLESVDAELSLIYGAEAGDGHDGADRSIRRAVGAVP